MKHHPGLVHRAIITKYKGQTDTLPARITALCDAARLTVSWDYELNIQDNHMMAAHALAMKLRWLDGFKLVGGGYQNGYCWVQVPKEPNND